MYCLKRVVKKKRKGFYNKIHTRMHKTPIIMARNNTRYRRHDRRGVEVS